MTKKVLKNANQKVGATLVEGKGYTVLLRHGVEMVGTFVRRLTSNVILFRQKGHNRETKIEVNDRTTFRKQP